MSLIRIDYDNVLAQAEKLQTSGDRCKELAQQARALSTSVSEYWKGDSGTAMQERLVEWASQQERTVQELIGSAADIRKIVQAIQDADKKAATRINSSLPEGAGSR